MRVAVHEPNGSVFAYKVGDVIDGHHNQDLLTGKITPIDEVLQGLAEQAQEEYPDAKVVIEKLVPKAASNDAESADGDDESEWQSVEEDAPEPQLVLEPEPQPDQPTPVSESDPNTSNPETV